MSRTSIRSQLLVGLAALALVTVTVWWSAVQSDDGRTEEARRIIVYTTTS